MNYLTVFGLIGVIFFAGKPRSFTLPSLVAKGPSIGVLPLDLVGVQYLVPLTRSYKLMGFTAGSVRFVVRSFFVGPVEQPHVDKVAKKFGGPRMQARFFWFFKLRTYIWVLPFPHPRRSMDPENQSLYHGQSMED